jgi:tetratricopeptide (TPR) repeat protein
MTYDSLLKEIRDRLNRDFIELGDYGFEEFVRGFALDELEKAVEWCQKFVKENPENPEVWYAWNILGIIHLTLGDKKEDELHFNKALTCFQKSIKIDPGLSETWLHMGAVYDGLYKLSGDKDSSLLRKSDECKSRFDKIEEIIDCGEFEEFQDSWRKIERINFCRRSTTESSSQKKDYAILINTFHPEANKHYFKGNSYLNEIKHKGSKKIYKKLFPFPKNAIEFIWPDSAHLNDFSVEELMKKAINEYDKAFEIDLNHFFAWLQKGGIYSELEDINRAINCLQRAVMIYPEFIVGWGELGLIYEMSGNLQKAVECYEKLLEIEPKYTKVWDRLAEIHKKLGNTAKVNECLHKANKYYKQWWYDKFSELNVTEKDDTFSS